MTDPHSRVHRTHAQRGVALISALLLLMLMSALAVAVLIKVNTEQRLQKTDTGNSLAYYGAEAGMEKLTADLGTLYTQNGAPNWCDITGLQAGFPTSVGVTYAQYQITVPPPLAVPAGCTAPPSRTQTISQGPNAGLIAQIVPLKLSVTADRPGGEEVAMVRQVEVALIPVFQFGVFSDSDLSFFPGPAVRLQRTGADQRQPVPVQPGPPHVSHRHPGRQGRSAGPNRERGGHGGPGAHFAGQHSNRSQRLP